MANTRTVMEAGLALKTHGLGCFLHLLHGQHTHSRFLVCGCQLLGLPINLSVFAQSPPLRLLQSTYVAFLPSSSWLIKVDMGVFRRFENSKIIVTPWSWTSPGNLLGRERDPRPAKNKAHVNLIACSKLLSLARLSPMHNTCIDLSIKRCSNAATSLMGLRTRSISSGEAFKKCIDFPAAAAYEMISIAVN